jgi:hypothetical protein
MTQVQVSRVVAGRAVPLPIFGGRIGRGIVLLVLRRINCKLFSGRYNSHLKLKSIHIHSWHNPNTGRREMQVI